MKAFRLGPAMVRPAVNEIEIEGRCERLPAKFIDVLMVLAEHPLQLCSKHDLLKRVWGDPMTGDEALAHAVWVLRRSLRDDAKRPAFIQTVPRRGYRLLLQPEYLPAATAEAVVEVGSGHAPTESTGDVADAVLAAPSTIPIPDAITAEIDEPDQQLPPPDTGMLKPQQAGKERDRPRVRTLLAALLLVLAGLLVVQQMPTPEVAVALIDAGDRLTFVSALSADQVLLSRRDGELVAWSPGSRHVHWRTRLGAAAAAPPLVMANEIIVGSDDDYLYALGLSDGRERWRFPAGADLRATPAMHNDLLELGNDQGLLLQYALATQSERWRSSLPGRIRGRLLSFGDLTLATTMRGAIHAVDRHDGRERWVRELGSGISTLVASGKSRVVFTLESGVLLALRVENGTEVWRVSLPAAASAPIIDGNRIFAIGREGDAVLVDAESGRIRWRTRLPVAGYQQPVWWGAHPVVVLDGSSIGLLDTERGTLLQRVHLPSPPDLLLGSQSRLLVASLDGRVFGFPSELLRSSDARVRVDAQGELHAMHADPALETMESLHSTAALPRLIRKIGSSGSAQDLAFDASGMLYVGDAAGVDALLPSGELRWHFPLSEAAGTEPVIVANRVLFGGNDGQLYALDRDSGRLLWQFATGDKVRSAPRAWNDHVYFGGVDGNVYALALADGRLRWRYQTQKSVHPALAIHDGIVFAGSGDQHLYALDAGSGELHWKRPMGDWVVAAPAVHAGRILVGVADGSVYSLNPQDGSVHWQFRSGGRIWFAVLAESNSIYFASGDGHVYALDSETGRERWRQRVGTQAEGRLVLHRGVVYAGSPDAFLYALDARTGKPLWRYATGGAVLNPALHEGRLAVGSSDQQIHLLDIGE